MGAAFPDLEKQGFLPVVFVIGNTADSPVRRDGKRPDYLFRIGH
jgi:hypothetical protein